MIRPVRFLGAANAELRKAVEYYDRQLSGLGDELLLEVERTILELCSFQRIGAPAAADTRRLPLKRFPFHVVYRLHGEELVILAVAHQRRRPDYWVARR